MPKPLSKALKRRRSKGLGENLGDDLVPEEDLYKTYNYLKYK